MSKVVATIIVMSTLILTTFQSPSHILAARNCSQYGISIFGSPKTSYEEGAANEIKLNFGILPAGDYSIEHGRGPLDSGSPIGMDFSMATNGNKEITLTDPQLFSYQANGQNQIIIIEGNVANDGKRTSCTLFSYKVTKPSQSCTINFTQDGFNNPGCIQFNQKMDITFSNVMEGGSPFNGSARVLLGSAPLGAVYITNGGPETKDFTPLPGQTNVNIKLVKDIVGTHVLCQSGVTIKVSNVCTEEERAPIDLNRGPESPPFELCNTIPPELAEQKTACTNCLAKQGVYTAIGCIPTNINDFATAAFTWTLSFAGGVALLLLLFGGFTIATSSGNPEQVQKGKDIIFGAIGGILFIIFSIVILNIIGVDILKIHGL